MQRGRDLEPHVLKEVESNLNIKILPCSNWPVFGASPDGLTQDAIIEVKCPTYAKRVED